MKKAISRRTFNSALLSFLMAPYVEAASFGRKNRGGERPYFSMRLPSKYNAMDVAFQSFTIDDRRNTIYGQFVTRNYPSQTIIAKYELIPYGEGLPLSMQPATEVIGHQGLTLEHSGSEAWMWAAAPGRSRDVVRFKYSTSGSVDVKRYTLFGAPFIPFAVTVTVSYDNKWLIAVSRKRGPSGSMNTVRVFNLEAVLNHPSQNCSQLFEYEWSILTKPGLPVQGLACYKDVVAISYGTSKAAAIKPVVYFSINGRELGDIPDINPGKDNLPARWSYEPEGLCYSHLEGGNEPLLYIGVTTGRAETGRTREIYALK
ncbi:hypothetical protein [Pseudomonas sp. Irchel s3h17]|uniref:phage baseplate protein n=1 Tax=Pseudomonas sp. Irchel s3h17 TaxID=2009182 RepID=UPI00117A3F3C|nr:hypothetical protein [Pseudomonas sp. Irchel s3h17]